MPLWTTRTRLGATAPFDFNQSLRFVERFSPTEGEQAVTPQALTKAVSIGGRAALFHLEAAGSAEAPAVDCALFAEQPLTAAEVGAVQDRAAFYLSLADDLGPFYRVGCADPGMAPIIERLYGLHQVKFLTPFENACWAVLAQRNRIAVARGLKRALVAEFGREIRHEGVTYAAFPEAADLADRPAEALAPIVGTERRAEYLLNVARAFAEVDEQWLRAAPYDDVAAWLRGVKGLGPWSAAFILTRGLGRMERLPAAEGEIVAAATRAYGGGRPLAPSEVDAIAERYGAARGYWAYYLRSGA
jgi:DNA-3-methyladenine glycosylase II